VDIAKSNGPLLVLFTVTVALIVGGGGGGGGGDTVPPPQAARIAINPKAAPNATLFIVAYSIQTSVRSVNSNRERTDPESPAFTSN
jgi:hypothetical protein